jgi:formylglycine-generating enzyme required for sulfatase activity
VGHVAADVVLPGGAVGLAGRAGPRPARLDAGAEKERTQDDQQQHRDEAGAGPGRQVQDGSPKDERGRSGDEGPQHDVEISRPFYLGVHEVTQKQFKTIMGFNPSWFSTDGKGKEGVDYGVDSPGKDPRGPATGEVRVFRGGAWTFKGGSRSARRERLLDPEAHSNETGFRVVCSVAARTP